MDSQKPLTYLLGQTMNLVKLKMQAEFKKQNICLTLDNFILLHYINTIDNITQQDLANHFQRDKSIILRQINAMIDLRYVVRMTDRQDKRKKNLILTKIGIETLNHAKQIAGLISTDLLQGISKNEIDVFEKVIEKIQLNTGHLDHPSNC